MSNKLSINRQRLFTQGYRKYLQSLTHGALVDFVLSGSDLSFSPAQERELLLDQVADAQGRHERATQKITKLVNENRRLNELLEKQAPHSTEGTFKDLISGYHDDVLQLVASIFAATLTPAPAQLTIVTFEDYMEAFPNAVFTKTVAIELGDPIPADVIEKCANLEELYLPFATVEEVVPGSPLRQVFIQFQNTDVANDFAQHAESIDITPAIYGLYVVNHGE